MESASMGDGTSGERIAAGQSDRRVRVPSQSAERAAPKWPARTLCHTPPLVRAFASRSIHNAAIRSDRDGRWSLVRHRRGPGEDARGRGRSCCPCWPPRDALEQVADSIRERGREAFPIVTDLTADASLANLVERARPELGPIDILINNAGFAVWKSLESTSLAEWDHTFAVNVRAAAYLCASVLPDMQKSGFGRIVNIGSEAGVAIVPGLAAYCVSKHALRALTEVIQEDNHTNGIKAWVVCPGFVDSDMGYVVPGANRAHFLQVEAVVEIVRFLLHTGENVKLGPEILVRTMRNPMSA